MEQLEKRNIKHLFATKTYMYGICSKIGMKNQEINKYQNITAIVEEKKWNACKITDIECETQCPQIFSGRLGPAHAG